MPEHIKTIKMGNSLQNILNRCGDDIRIDWGYFYLSIRGKDENVFGKSCCDMEFVAAESSLSSNDALFTFAYDDIYSMVYFNERLKSYWNKDGESITEAISKAYGDYTDCFEKAKYFSDELFIDAVKAGGEKYAELLQLALRQVLAAHKLVLDKNSDILYISKECFSNGCAATVDLSYPSIPMFLLYNPELIRGMMRPIFKYAGGNVWPFDFAPHDVGTYPFLNGQVYSEGINPDYQMPVEECGNMLIMTASNAIAENDTSFADEHMEVLEKWAKYLIKYGTDPENQLCTDDFAGHLAHNCNLSLKAIMGLTGLSIIFKMTGNRDKEKYYSDTARCMAETWLKTAANGDGTYKLAFDRENTFSMKYNMVWDKIFNTGVFPKASVISEFSGYSRHINKYGMPLDNRATYTKSDWLVWCATLTDDCRRFEEFIEPLWSAYNYSPSRVPMTDWYDTVTSVQVGFQHRTVQGGLFMKLLDYKGNMRVK